MESSKTLRRPANWQDFETLCKKLWGEIWKCPEIKKNGRAGQAQYGVDIYGIPRDESAYFGIQCKGKEEYYNKQFTEVEIACEIEKARNFHPSLRKLYFATTALKDVKIEEFIRKKNIESIAFGLFEVHLFSWEDIVELIDENKQTHDWYVKSQNYKTEKSVTVTFDDGSIRIAKQPKFTKSITRYHPKFPLPASFHAIQKVNAALAFGTMKRFFLKKENFSYFRVAIKIHNSGTAPLEEYKLFLSFDGDINDIAKTNVEDNSVSAVIKTTRYRDVKIFAEERLVKILPQNAILVGDDILISDDFFIKTSGKQETITINWKLISKDFKDEGILSIDIEPTYIVEYKYEEVDDKENIRNETAIIDYIVEE